MKTKVIKIATALTLMSMLSACAATQVAMSKRNLDVQTKMSATLFIDPVENPAHKTIYVQSKNTSDKPDFNIAGDLMNSLSARGFRIVQNPKDAQYFLQVNTLQVGKSDATAAEAAVYRGYGMEGVVIGATATSMVGGSDNAVLAGGLVGGLAAIVADSMVKDVYYSVITDIQIKERVRGKGKVTNTSLHMNQSGTSGGTVSSYTEKNEWKIYQTRVLSSANKVNLDFAVAAPELKQSLVRTIANIF